MCLLLSDFSKWLNVNYTKSNNSNSEYYTNNQTKNNVHIEAIVTYYVTKYGKRYEKY